MEFRCVRHKDKRVLYSFAVAVLGWWAFSQPAAASEPTSSVEVGFEQRVRNENWNNIFDYSDAADDQRNQIRYRTRLWSTFHVSPKLDVNVGLDQETNEIVVPHTPFKFDEIIFETFNLDFHDVLAKGLSFKVGRQNLIKDDGWLFIEGNPWDGSRAVYSNAFDLTYARGKSKFEAIGVWNPARDRFLPRIHNVNRQLVEWDEQAIGGTFNHALRKDTDVEAYYFLKKEYHDRRPVTNPQFQPDRHIHTAGGRIVRRFQHDLKWVFEGDEQWGHDHAGSDLRGWGAYTTLRKSLKRPGQPYVQAGWYGFSGDDPATRGVNEGWDPLFSRWPAWSELYIYSQFKEQGVGYWTNLSMWQAETAFTPWKDANWRFTYYRMDAFQYYPHNPAIFGPGTGRGNMFQSRLDFKLNSQLRGHALYEVLLPGSYYRVGDLGYFLRFEMIYSLKHKFGLGSSSRS
jgi:hypothetical protein